MPLGSLHHSHPTTQTLGRRAVQKSLIWGSATLAEISWAECPLSLFRSLVRSAIQMSRWNGRTGDGKKDGRKIDGQILKMFHLLVLGLGAG